MSPRVADPGVRAALIEAAAELVANSIPLTARGVAAEVGTSAMAVYTHFGSMEELRRAVRREGFNRFAARLAEVPHTRDPVADLYMLGWVYTIFAINNPHLYRVMFIEPIQGADVGWDALELLIDGFERCIKAERFVGDDAWPMALHGWAFTHGFVMIAFTETFSLDELLGRVTEISEHLFVGFGDTHEAARRSIKTAQRRIARNPAYALPPLPNLIRRPGDLRVQ